MIYTQARNDMVGCSNTEFVISIRIVASSDGEIGYHDRGLVDEDRICVGLMVVT